MAIKTGKQTYILTKPVFVHDRACIVGQMEKDGPLGEHFEIVQEPYFGRDTWERAEAQFQAAVYNKLLAISTITEDQIDCVLAGDLLSQCSASALGLVEGTRPFLGMFGACSTMAEALLIGSLLIDGGGMNNCICLTSSHFCSAEKQFRFPLELGTQRAPTSQWTVTGCGGVILSSEKAPVKITSVTPGIMTDMKITDTNNMGAAMACAAASTITAHFKDTGRKPDYYDLIVTGDLGILGRELMLEVLKKQGISVPDKKAFDCGAEIFNQEKQKTNCGGSGCGCCASVLTAYLLKQLEQGVIKRILFTATGALMSAVSVKQGDPIVGIAHSVVLERE
ncbi:MAG: stage V sporulation protein AD [Ruminococcaceae bacterium]|nr:stage V sporulation protein AD [Oscillospiraceae bacterium]